MPCATTTAPPTAAMVLRRRRAASGMSVSFLGVGLDGGDHSLDRDASAGGQVATGVPYRCAEWRSPRVLPHEYGRRAAGLDGLCEVGDVLFAEQHRQFGFVAAQVPDLAVVEIGGLECLQVPVVVLPQEQ